MTDFDRNHSHHIGGRDLDCRTLTHCPAVCDCPMDLCTAALLDYDSGARMRASMQWAMKVGHADTMAELADAHPGLSAEQAAAILRGEADTALAEKDHWDRIRAAHGLDRW